MSVPRDIVLEDLKAQSPFRIDEGFSEETRSLEGDDGPDADAFSTSLREWILAQPAYLRAAMVRDIMSSLPTTMLPEIIADANDRLHFDPVRCLPHEMMAYIFEFLEPPDLVNASLVSKLWRERAAEPRIWRRLFGLEGWTFNGERMQSFERRSRSQIRKLWSKGRVRSRPFPGSPDRSPEFKRMRRSEGSLSGGQIRSRLWVQDGSIKIPRASVDKRKSDASQTAVVDEKMRDVTDSSFIDDALEMESGTASQPGIPESPVCPLLKPSHIRDTASSVPQPNWQYIYSQRRRLEQNWTEGRFKNFRLPHCNYRSEAHSECVYTLQFTAAHVVSGSRDKTVRVWDLKTQRLKLPPLVGHEGSVLCLQFDERPSEDIIVSGGSDADIIVWKFSTGAVIERLHQAHTESVLNLRFDERYLVTCSKDRTIKLWNRKELRPTDKEYPKKGARSSNDQPQSVRYPEYIVDLQDISQNPRSQPSEPLRPFTLLMTFDEHNAAVNAIQILGDQIVSASGDRKIMLWDIGTGSRVRMFAGHSKGIACVQYDGRRIISGSSDNSVRIFDSATSAEVAVLDGHRSLVRTVQADFGDLPSDEEEEAARHNDKRLVQEQISQTHATSAASETDPSASNEHFVFGAKLPPGGGGNRWSKIVSGSYDETVIIWRKDKSGAWVAARELRQEDAMRATSLDIGPMPPPPPNPNVQPRRPPTERQPLSAAQLFQEVQAGAPSRAAMSAERRQRAQRRLQTLQTAQGWMQMPPNTSANRAQQTAAAASEHANPAESNAPSQQPADEQDLDAPAEPFAFSPPEDVAGDAHPAPAHPHPNPPHFQHTVAPPTQARRRQQQQEPPVPDTPAMSRVFKLQFDTRRIVCCSQQPVIVGWDFANGDRDIEEACQFFS